MARNLRRYCLFIVAFFLVSVFSALAAAQSSQTGILNIDSSPSGAVVYVNGKKRGTTPVLLEVQAQTHEIVVQQDGYETYRQKIAVKKDKVLRTKVSLKKKPEPTDGAAQNDIEVKNDIHVYTPKEESEPGTIFLATTPESLTAYINGFKISKLTPVAFDIRPGIYELQLKNKNNEVVYQKTIFVRSGKTLSLDIVIQKKRTIDYTDPWK
ncbi:MAG: PEGA domain-containing protein [Deltaproteobacteria bacterium]|nr:PEGA domain-containing protein [Deltaproteobacteria bacterium]MBN2673305.1 PEGA domain-containing protein [Deltaproteobacteria bacterium]